MTLHLVTLCGAEQWVKSHEKVPPRYFRVPLNYRTPISANSPMQRPSWSFKYRLFEIDEEKYTPEDFRVGLVHYREVPE